MLLTQSYLTLYEPMDCSLPGFSVHRILQARILEWIAIPFSRGFSQPRDQTLVSPALHANSLPFKLQMYLLYLLKKKKLGLVFLLNRFTKTQPPGSLAASLKQILALVISLSDLGS